MWFELLITAIGSGSLSGIITWLFSKRKRNNDFLAELQGSIDILSKNYTETLNKLVEVQRLYAELKGSFDELTRNHGETLKQLGDVQQQNSELLKGQADMQSEITKLKNENGKLIRKINDLSKRINTTEDEKSTDNSVDGSPIG